MTSALEGGEWSAARPGRTFPPGKDPVPILQEAGWAPGPVWTGGKSRPHQDFFLLLLVSFIHACGAAAHSENMTKIRC